MMEIVLRGGAIMLVDDDDYDRFKDGYGTINNGKYAARKMAGKVVVVHRVLCPVPEGMIVDHIDGNGLNNQKANLRPSFAKQNGANRRKRKDSAHIFKGIRIDRNKYVAEINARGNYRYLGRFDDAASAARAYDIAALEEYGDFAATNERLGLFKTA